MLMLQYGKKDSLKQQQENLLSISQRSKNFAIYCPKEVAVMHCKGRNRDGSKVAEDNQLANCQARKAALLRNPFTTDAFDLDRSCGTGETTIY